MNESRNRLVGTLGVAVVVALLALGLVACGDFASGMRGAEFGATQGGVQDLGLAREYIANGTIPPPEAFVVEGMFSEHDLPLAGAPCETLLCLRGAAGAAPDLDGQAAGWMQVGMSSTIDPEAWVRPSQTLIMTVDVSCSMGWDYSSETNEYASPGTLTRELLHEVAGRLGPRDQVAIVTYGSRVRTPLDLTAADDPRVAREIDRLDSGGSTNMEAGLKRAYSLAGSARDTDEVRVMLFTDARPNVGATQSSEFGELVADAASEGVHTTVFGMGLGLGQEVFEAMSHLRGGNAYSFFDSDDIARTMEESWPWLLTPIAHDLSVAVVADSGFEVARAYGFPGSDGPDASYGQPGHYGAPGLDASRRVGFEVASVFLSRKRGALLIELAPTTGPDIAGLRLTGTLRYETPGGRSIEERLEVQVTGEERTDERGHYFEQSSVEKTVALALAVEGMREAAELYGTDPEAAEARMETVVSRLTADTASLGDEALEREVELASALATLIAERAGQTDLYGN